MTDLITSEGNRRRDGCLKSLPQKTRPHHGPAFL